MSASQRIPVLGTLVAAVIASGNIGCGGGAAVVPTQLAVTVSMANVPAGMPVNVSVRALDASGALATTHVGTVHFTSSDAQATLPADSKLPGGTGNFSVTLKTIGSQTFTATDTITVSLKGPQASTPLLHSPFEQMNGMSETAERNTQLFVRDFRRGSGGTASPLVD